MVQTEEEERRAPRWIATRKTIPRGGWAADRRTLPRDSTPSRILGESVAVNGVGGRVSARPRRDWNKRNAGRTER